MMKFQLVAILSLFLILSPCAEAIVIPTLGCECPCDDDFSTPEIGYLDGYPNYDAWDLGPAAGANGCAGTSVFTCSANSCTCDFLLVPQLGSGQSFTVQRTFTCGVPRRGALGLSGGADPLESH